MRCFMKFIFVPVFILATTVSQAKDVKNPSNYKTLDIKQFDQVKSHVGNPTSVQFSSTCKTENGKEIKSTDSGYQSCLEKSQSKSKVQGD